MRLLIATPNDMNNRRRLVQSVNALVTGAGAFVTFIRLLRLDTISSGVQSLPFVVMIAFIAGGGFWRATRDYIDKISYMSQAS
jgi:hypothetical protein